MPDVDPEESTISYLKHLRQVNDSAPAQAIPPPIASPPVVSSQESAAINNERRRHPRYKCAGSAELRKEGTTVRTWGTFTDISQSGCYVEMQATFPPETKTELVLELNEIRVCAKAIVRVTYPFLGMGLVFTEIREQDRVLLAKILEFVVGAAQGGAGCVPRQEPEKKASNENVPELKNHKAVLDALLRHFDQQENLTRERFLSLLRTSQSTQ
jgi:PilZ domain